jgi:hypothetical protein
MEASVKRNALMGLFVFVLMLWVIPTFYQPSMLNAQSLVSWVTVRDNREQAFSIEVPRGWKVYGGMFRFSAVDARPLVDMTSPDERTNVRLGDATIPGYVVPSPWMARQPHMAAYASGDVFARKYGEARFRSMCQSLQVQQVHPMTPKYHNPGQGMIRITGGEAFFACSEKGQAMAGYVYAETILYGTGGPNSIWTIVTLGSILAPAEQGQAAGAILKHAGESLTLNPEWAKIQKDLDDQENARLQGRIHQTILATQAENAREQGIIQNMGRQNENFNDIINGVTFTRDPQTGQTREVQTGQGGPYWTNGLDTVMSSTFSPGPAYRQLQVISR